jgi:uncharacterized protein HemX
MMKVLRNILGAALVAVVLCAGAQGTGFVQRKGEEKKDPPKQEKVVEKADKQPKSNEQPRNNNQQNRGNDNKKPPF